MRIRLALTAAAIVILPVAPAFAEHDPYSGAPLPPSKKHETPSPITDRFYVAAIYYRPVVKTPIRVDPHEAALGVGTNITAERDLGLDSRLNMPRIEMMFRLRERNKIRVDFLEVNRDATHTLSRTIDFGNEVFQTRSLVASSLDYRMFGLTYTYSIFRNDRFEIGTGLGVDLVQAEAMAQVNLTQQRQDVSGAGPFPTIPLDLALRISRRWSVTARGQYFHASLNNFDGYLAQVHEDVQYRWKDNFSLGVGYTSVRAKLALHTGNFPGLFAMSLEGPEAYFKVSF